MTPRPPDVAPPAPGRRRPTTALVAVLALAPVLALVGPGATPAGAASGSGSGSAGQTLTVSQVDDLDPDGTTVTVTGTGFDAGAGFDIEIEGLYLSVCVDNGPGMQPTPCIGGIDQSGETATTRWVTNNPVGGSEAVAIEDDGSFATTLWVTGQDEHSSCFELAVGKSCKIVTRVDHRAGGDRSQDVKVAISFADRRTATESFVTAALTDFLGIEPTPQQVAAGVAQVQQVGKPRYLRDLSTSDAWLAAVVDKLYLDTLGRTSDAPGRAFWIDQLRRGRHTVASAGAEFYASGEYFRGLGGGTVGSWIDDLYQKILLRTSDTTGRAYWVGQVSATSRGSVAYRFYQSTESAQTRVKGLYQALLGRGADRAGIAFWAPRVVAGGDLVLAAFLADSPEYQNRAVSRFP